VPQNCRLRAHDSRNVSHELPEGYLGSRPCKIYGEGPPPSKKLSQVSSEERAMSAESRIRVRTLVHYQGRRAYAYLLAVPSEPGLNQKPGNELPHWRKKDS